MSVEVVTKEDLQALRIQLMEDIRLLLEQEHASAGQTEWMKSAEVRKILKMSPASLQNLRISGRLKPVKISGSWYYNRIEVMALFKQS